jgi:hypothetical protein
MDFEFSRLEQKVIQEVRHFIETEATGDSMPLRR